MRLTLLTGALAASSHLASAHYIFDKLILNGQLTKDWEYVRKHQQSPIYMPTKGDDALASPDFRCNKGAYNPVVGTKTAIVNAGDTIGFHMGLGATMKHPGPMLVYMSKAPGTAAEYDGSGDWFKVYEQGICGDLSTGYADTKWCTWDKDEASFSIPASTPSGDYLVRVEHIGLHGAHARQDEFYISCAQITVQNGGDGTPGPLVKIPGVYTLDSPGIKYSIWNNPKSYTMPGPAVWGDGGAAAVRNETDGNGGSSVVAQSTTVATRVRSQAATSTLAAAAADGSATGKACYKKMKA